MSCFPCTFIPVPSIPIVLDQYCDRRGEWRDGTYRNESTIHGKRLHDNDIRQ